MLIFKYNDVTNCDVIQKSYNTCKQGKAVWIFFLFFVSSSLVYNRHSHLNANLIKKKMNKYI